MGITCEALDKEISALKAGKMTWDTVKQLNRSRRALDRQ